MSWRDVLLWIAIIIVAEQFNGLVALIWRQLHRRIGR